MSTGDYSLQAPLVSLFKRSHWPQKYLSGLQVFRRFNALLHAGVLWSYDVVQFQSGCHVVEGQPRFGGVGQWKAGVGVFRVGDIHGNLVRGIGLGHPILAA